MAPLVSFAAALPGLALAEEPAQALPSFGPLLLQVSVTLLFVCALAWLLIRFGLARLRPPASPESHLELLDRLPLGARRSVVLLRAVDRVLVVGETEAGLSLLSDLGPGSAQELGADDFAAAMEAATPPDEPPTAGSGTKSEENPPRRATESP